MQIYSWCVRLLRWYSVHGCRSGMVSAHICSSPSERCYGVTILGQWLGICPVEQIYVAGFWVTHIYASNPCNRAVAACVYRSSHKVSGKRDGRGEVWAPSKTVTSVYDATRLYHNGSRLVYACGLHAHSVTELLRLSESSVNVVNCSMHKILNEHSRVYRVALGCSNNFKAHLYPEEGPRPVH